MGISIYTLNMVDTGNYVRVTNDDNNNYDDWIKIHTCINSIATTQQKLLQRFNKEYNHMFTQVARLSR